MSEDLDITIKLISELDLNELDFIIMGMKEGIKSGCLLLNPYDITRRLICHKIDGVDTQFSNHSLFNKNSYLVAYYKKEIAGFVEIAYYPSRRDFEIHYIFVQSELTRKKIATFLIKKAFIQIALISKTEKIINPNVFARVLTAKKNIPSDELFKSLKFNQSYNISPYYVWHAIGLKKFNKLNR